MILGALLGAGAGLAVAAGLGLPIAIGLAGAALLLALAGLLLALRIRSLRLAVEPDYLHLTGFRVDRRYHLAPGPLARVPSNGVTRRRRLSALGGAVGRARLETTGETIELIQLGTTPSVIVVPTEKGRVALAAAAEGELIEALMDAARTRAARPEPARVTAAPAPTAVPAAAAAPAPTTAPAMPGAAPGAMPATTAAVVATAAAAVTAPALAPPRPPAPAPPPRPLTGIERMALEERMARERQAALTGAQTEQAAASLTASSAAMTAPGRPAIPFLPTRPAPQPVAAPPAAATAAAPAMGAAAPAVAATPAATRTFPRALPRALPRRRPVRPMARRVAPPSLGPDLAMLGTPLVGAAVVWALAVFAGSRPAADGLDPIGFALLLCGPVAVLAAFLARSRWPRLAGLTSVAAVIGLALVVRALIG
jgi:hypothetical protein